MAISPKILLVELVMSIDRMIECAKTAKTEPGEWNPSTVLGHVAQVDQQVWQARVEQMVTAQNLGQAEPSFISWEPDPIATAEKFSSVSIEDAAGTAMQARTALVTFLNSLTPEQWNARASHSTFGSIDVSELIFQALTHDEEHRASLI